MRAFDFEMSRRGFASALAAGALSLALAGCGGGAAGAGSAAGSAAGPAADGATAEPVEVHVASLKGPTSIGLVQFMDRAADGETDNEFDFAMNTAADEIVPRSFRAISTLPWYPPTWRAYSTTRPRARCRSSTSTRWVC